jgi:hypothetical protein
MEKVLKDAPQAAYAMPEGMAVVRINEAGQRDENGSLAEFFYQENIPSELPPPPLQQPGSEVRPAETLKDQLL